VNKKFMIALTIIAQRIMIWVDLLHGCQRIARC